MSTRNRLHKRVATPFRAAFTGRRRSLFPVLIAAVTSASGCGGGGGGGGSEPVSSSQDEQRFAVNPAALDFGDTFVGETGLGVFVVTNEGTRAISLTATDPGEGFTLTDNCGSLPRGQQCELRVEFSPTEQRDYSSSIDITAGPLRLSPSLTGRGQGLEVQILNVDRRCEDSTFTAFVSVTGADQQPNLDLRDDQFSAFVQGTESSPIADIEVVTQRQPAAVGLALDWSSSLEDFRPDLVDATRIFIESLGFEEDGLMDRAGVFRFSSTIDRNAQAFVDADDAGKAALTAALTADFVEEPGSNVWASTDFVVEQVAGQPNPIRVAVLLSDGRNNAGEITFIDVFENALAREVSVFTIGYGDLNPGPMQRLANETGGLFFSDPDARGLMRVFENITSLLTNQYQLSYRNPAPESSVEFRMMVRDDAGLEGEDIVTIASCS